jgi:hypothetical protein
MEAPFVDTIAGTQNESIADLRELVSRALEIPRRRSSRTFPGDNMEYWNAWYANRGVEVPGSGMADFIAYARRPPEEREAEGPSRSVSGSEDTGSASVPRRFIPITSDSGSTSTFSNSSATAAAAAAGAAAGPELLGQETLSFPVCHSAVDLNRNADALQPTSRSQSLAGVNFVDSLSADTSSADTSSVLQYSADSTPLDEAIAKQNDEGMSPGTGRMDSKVEPAEMKNEELTDGDDEELYGEHRDAIADNADDRKKAELADDAHNPDIDPGKSGDDKEEKRKDDAAKDNDGGKELPRELKRKRAVIAILVLLVFVAGFTIGCVFHDMGLVSSSSTHDRELDPVARDNNEAGLNILQTAQAEKAAQTGKVAKWIAQEGAMEMEIPNDPHLSRLLDQLDEFF